MAGMNMLATPPHISLHLSTGVIAVANAIPDMGALSVLSLSDNHLRAEGGKALAEGLKDNQLITELNISNNYLGSNSTYEADTSGVIAIATVIPSMEAMSSFTFGDKQTVTMTTAMTEANFSGKLFSHEAQMVAAFLPKCTWVSSEYPLPISLANISYRQQGDDEFESFLE
jgi:hypothetical protein